MNIEKFNANARCWHAESRRSKLQTIDGDNRKRDAGSTWTRVSACVCLVLAQFGYSVCHADTLLIKNQFNISGIFDFKNVLPINYVFDAPLPSRYYGQAQSRTVTFDTIKIKTSGAPALAFGSLDGYLALRTEPRPPFGQSYFTLGSVHYQKYSGDLTGGLGPMPPPDRAFSIFSETTKFSFITNAQAVGCPGNVVNNACLESFAGNLDGQFFVKMTESVIYDLDRQSFSQKISRWLNNDAPTSISNIKRIIREEVTEHAIEAERKGLFVPELPRNGGPGIRGSVDFIGTTVFTASPGVLSYDITLPQNENFLSVPLAFTRNNRGSFVDMFFDDKLLLRVEGDDYNLNDLQVFDLNVSALKGRQGTLSFVVNTNGSESAEIFVPDSIAENIITFTDPALAVPEPQTWAMTLLGLAGMGLWLLGRKRVGGRSKE